MSNLINLLDTYKGEKRELYPLTPSQMGVYLSCMHNPKGTMYNIPCTYVFDSGSLDTDRLINAVRKAVDNHPIMKIFIDSSTGSPMMKPRDSVEFDIPVVQVNNLEQAKILLSRLTLKKTFCSDLRFLNAVTNLCLQWTFTI